MSWTVRVPASSANLGPGFDALGLALALYLKCRFRRSRKLSIRVSGLHASEISTGQDNLIWQTALKVAGDYGKALPPAEIEIFNEIPLGKGLGSSAAALTAGVVIADRLLGLKMKPPRILDEAARIEGHPDNVAACVLGSMVASAIDEGGAVRAVKVNLPAKFKVGVVVPDFPLPTAKARKVLPSRYSKQDAIFNLQRAVLLIAALATGTSSAFPTALEDRVHQPYREKLVPGLREILRLRAPGLLGCTLSGAGPSVLVFYETGHAETLDLVRQIFALHGKTALIYRVGVSREGYQIQEDKNPWPSIPKL